MNEARFFVRCIYGMVCTTIATFFFSSCLLVHMLPNSCNPNVHHDYISVSCSHIRMFYICDSILCEFQHTPYHTVIIIIVRRYAFTTSEYLQHRRVHKATNHQKMSNKSMKAASNNSSVLSKGVKLKGGVVPLSKQAHSALAKLVCSTILQELQRGNRYFRPLRSVHSGYHAKFLKYYLHRTESAVIGKSCQFVPLDSHPNGSGNGLIQSVCDSLIHLPYLSST